MNNQETLQLSPVDPEKLRKKIIDRCKLTSDATWTQINETLKQEHRMANARYLKIPEDATWTQIRVGFCQDSCNQAAVNFGLMYDASWADISAIGSEVFRTSFLNATEKEQLREDEIKKLGLPPNATQMDINAAYGELMRKRDAAELGLPESVCLQVIREAQEDQGRKIRAIELGLPENATYEEIRNRYDELHPDKDNDNDIVVYEYPPKNRAQREFDTLEKEKLQRENAMALGLPENSSVQMISQARHEQDRKQFAKNIGLSQDATWDDIAHQEAINRLEQIRKEAAARFGLADNVTWEQTEAKIVEIIRDDPTNYALVTLGHINLERTEK